MIDERERYERAFQQFEMPEPAWDRLNRRRDRKRRDQRIRAGILGLAIAIAVGWLGVNAIRSMPPVPTDDPTPTPGPVGVGALAYAVDGDIFVAEWDGSNPVRIADGRPPSDCGSGLSYGMGEYFAFGSIWSPDGRYLAYRHADCDGGSLDGWQDVVISDPQGNVVTSFPSEGWGISWSPDSTRVAVWVRWGEEPRTIGVYGINGERQTLLTVPGLPHSDAAPGWASDGESLLLGNFEIPLDGTPERRLRTEGGRIRPTDRAGRIRPTDRVSPTPPASGSLLPRPMVHIHRRCSRNGSGPSRGRQPVIGSPSPRGTPPNSACSTWRPER